MGDYPPFPGAVERFTNFLRANDAAGELAWVVPDDVALIPPRLFLRPRGCDAALKRAQRDYRLACDRRFGVELGVLCRLGAGLCCFVYGPDDEDEAARRMMPDGLKLTLPHRFPEAELARGRLQWAFVSRRSRRWREQKLFLFHQESHPPSGAR